MRLSRPLASFAAGILCLTGALAQNFTTPQNLTAFADPNYNLTTINIEYSVHTGCGPDTNLTTIRRRVSYVVVNGLAIIDGDIVYGTEADILRDMVPDDSDGSVLQRDLLHDSFSKRALSVRPSGWRWPGAVIPYTFGTVDPSIEESVAENRRGVFRDAVKVWRDRLPWLDMHEDTTAYDREATSTAERITVDLIAGCVSWSPVGRAGSQRASVISLGCVDLGTYAHEIGHSLGLKHEHQRPDRESYFTLDCSRIDDADSTAPVCTVPCQGWGCAFEMLTDSTVFNWEGPYDTNSIMHYHETAFAANFAFPPLIGVTADVRVGTSDRPSLMDTLRVCEIYHEQCTGKGICGDGILSPANGEECDPGCGGLDTCTEDCKKISPPPCIQTCDPAVPCHETTSCIRVEGGTAASAGKHYCACRHGFRAPSGTPQMRLPWYSPVSQEGRVFVEPGQGCNELCDAWTLGKDGCKEVDELAVCY